MGGPKKINNFMQKAGFFLEKMATFLTPSFQKRAKCLRGPSKIELDIKTTKKIKNMHDDTKT